MRSDMKKVVAERPRSGRSYAAHHKYYRKKPTLIVDEEGNLEAIDSLSVGGKISLRGGKFNPEHKSFSDLIGPLRRFLHSKIGQKWDDVYSEIAEHLKGGTTLQQHIRDHVRDFVATKTLRIEGKDYQVTTYGIRELWVYPAFYVDPVNGNLTRSPGYGRRLYKPLARSKYLGRRVLDGTEVDYGFRKVNETWYEVWYQKSVERERKVENVCVSKHRPMVNPRFGFNTYKTVVVRETVPVDWFGVPLNDIKRARDVYELKHYEFVPWIIKAKAATRSQIRQFKLK